MTARAGRLLAILVTLWLVAAELPTGSGAQPAPAHRRLLPILPQRDSPTTWWVARAPMVVPRSRHVASLGPDGRVYAFTGNDRSFERYDPTTDQWTWLGYIPGLGPVTDMQGALVQGRMHLLCYDGRYVHQAYHPGTGWQDRAINILHPQFPAAVSTGARLYVIGGRAGPFPLPVPPTFEYDPVADSWRRLADLPTARAELVAVLAPNGKIYAIGGNDGTGQPTGAVEEYDLATDTWRRRAPMPTPRYFLAAGVGYDGRIYAMGGITRAPGETSRYSAAVEAYDPGADTWAPAGRLTWASQGAAAVTLLGGRLLITGGSTGMDGDNLMLRVVEELVPG